MRSMLVGMIMLVAAAMSSWAGTNQTFLTTADYRRMLDALERSPDVAIPKPEEGFVDGARPTYQFVCSGCGLKTRYWREGVIDWDHIGTLRERVATIRGLRCDAWLDDTWLCQYCHPERFLPERRPVSVVLKRGFQNIPHCTGTGRYVPKEMKLSVKDISHGGAEYWLGTKYPYTIVERDAIDGDNRLNRDVFASSFIPVRVSGKSEVDRRYEMLLAKTQGVGLHGDEVKRSLRKGTLVQVEDLPPPVGEHLTGTNGWSKYCLVSTPGRKMELCWECSVNSRDVSNVIYEEGVRGAFKPVFLSVNGGEKFSVTERELNVLIAFLSGRPLVSYHWDCCCTTKSNIQWLRKLLLSEAAAKQPCEMNTSRQYVSETAKRLKDVALRCPEFSDAIKNGCLHRMDWVAVGNLAARRKVVTDMDRRNRTRALKAVEAMQQATSLIHRHGRGFGFGDGLLDGANIKTTGVDGVLAKYSYGDEYLVPWTEFFSRESDCARKLFAHCVQREWPGLVAKDRPHLPQLGFVLLLKYIVPEAPAPVESYRNDILRLRSELEPSRPLGEDIKLLFPEIRVP